MSVGSHRTKKDCLLSIEGRSVNHKRIERLWREEGLQLPHRHKKRKRLYHKDSSVIRLGPQYPGHVWSIDFVHDKLSNGRSYKMLTVIDEYTRETLCVAAKPRMGHAEMLDVLYPLFLKHGKSMYLRSDNGPEFIARDLRAWLNKVGIQPIQIDPGSLWENRYKERFGARCSMGNGSQQSNRSRPSSTGGSNNTITSARIRP